MTDWYAATLPLPYADSTLARVRSRAASRGDAPTGGNAPFENELGLGTTIQLEPLRQYTLGILALRLHDEPAAADAAAALRHLAAQGDANALVRDLDRGLRAQLAWRAGRADEALDLLESLELHDTQGDIAVTPFVTRANERHLHAEILASVGRDEEALRWFASLGDGAATEIPLRALSHLRQAEIRERLGQHREAAQNYERFADLWRNADPVIRPRADSARSRLARLKQEE